MTVYKKDEPREVARKFVEIHSKIIVFILFSLLDLKQERIPLLEKLIVKRFE